MQEQTGISKHQTKEIYQREEDRWGGNRQEKTEADGKKQGAYCQTTKPGMTKGWKSKNQFWKPHNTGNMKEREEESR